MIGDIVMDEQTNAPETAETVTAAVEAPVEAPAAPAPKPARAKAAKDVVAAVKKVNARRVKTERKPRARKPVQVAAATAAETPQIEKETVMNFDPTNWMNNFGAFTTVPGTERFQALFTEAGERGREAVERSRNVAEELAELTRANVEALVETGRIAAAGAQSLGQETVERAREGFEQAAAQTKTLADANGPAEFFQLQGEIVRSQFDRFVAEGSRLTESLVKLTGEALQPLSNRAAINAEKLNELTA